MEEEKIVFIVIVLFLTGIFIGMTIGRVLIEKDEKDYSKQLGGYVCEKAYGYDFQSYENGVLTCKPKEKKQDDYTIKIKGDY